MIETAKKVTNASHAIIVMSSSFVQRGEPACFDKWTRASCALRCGASMVLELPVLFSAANAEIFATGAIKVFNDSGMIDALCFGSESGDLASMEEAAKLVGGYDIVPENVAVKAIPECNIVCITGEDMKEQFAKLEITKLPQLLSEVQRRIGIINQKEAFCTNDETKTLINEAMMDIEFTFSKIGQEEMRLISGGAELKEKWQRTIASFTQNFDQEDPEFMSLRDAFMERFKEHGFVIDTIAKFNEETQALDEIVKRLQDLQKRNNVLLKKYKGDEKFARVHKRIREVNKQRQEKGQKPMFSFLDEEIAVILNIIKEDVDAKVYDRNDILKKDAYFGRTVMALINGCLYHFPQIKPEMEDYKFIQTRISQQYINQYNATYGIS